MGPHHPVGARRPPGSQARLPCAVAQQPHPPFQDPTQEEEKANAAGNGAIASVAYPVRSMQAVGAGTARMKARDSGVAEPGKGSGVGWVRCRATWSRLLGIPGNRSDHTDIPSRRRDAAAGR
jgi:hypothetical protein